MKSSFLKVEIMFTSNLKIKYSETNWLKKIFKVDLQNFSEKSKFSTKD